MEPDANKAREKERKISVLVQKIIETTQQQLPAKETLALLMVFIVCWFIDKRGKEKRITFRWMFSVFLILYITVLRREREESFVHLIPFQFVTLRTLYTDFLNTVLFLPFGYELRKVCDKQNDLQGIKQNLLYGFLLSCFVELLQLVFKRGVFDTEDLIFNTMGAMFGGILYGCSVKMFSRTNNRL